MFNLFIKVLCLVFLISALPCSAGQNVNIYKKARKTPARVFMHESGQRLSLSDFKGDFVLAHFWSRNCGPCVRELKNLNRFYKDMSNKGIRLVLISSSGEWKTPNEQKRFLKKYGAPDVPFYMDQKSSLADDFGIISRPHTVLINAKGEEIGRIRGSAKWDDPRVEKYIYKLKSIY